VLLDDGILDLDELGGEALEARHLQVGAEVLVHGLREEGGATTRPSERGARQKKPS
jgi:hypothetical protein